MTHPWFEKYPIDTEQKIISTNEGINSVSGADLISDEVLERLKTFKGVSTFKKAAMNLLVKTATEEEVQDLRAQFQAIDTDGTGMIKAQELHDILV